MREYRYMYIPATRCKELRRGGARLESRKPVCAGLYDFVMLHYADDVLRMRYSCGCAVSADMKGGEG